MIFIMKFILYLVNEWIIMYHLLLKLYPGDHLVGEAYDSHSWPTPQDVEMTLTYPSEGEGAILTFVDIKITQDTKDGEVHVVSGGIGQREIKIVVSAYDTRTFNYNCEWYGF